MVTAMTIAVVQRSKSAGLEWFLKVLGGLAAQCAPERPA